jgi:polyisoprenoid-binding protein YceI
MLARMPVAAGTHRLGPESATLSVRTGRAGAAAKAGHDLLLHVTAWEATIEIAGDPARTELTLVADPTSLRVREGTGGIQALGDDDIANIHQTIDDEVLRGREIAFRSTAVEPGPDGSMHVEGELTLAGAQSPIAFDLALGDDGAVAATAVVKQSDWKLKPYSALFGALKVADEVEVALEGRIGT